jgi:hypothetical protein
MNNEGAASLTPNWFVICFLAIILFFSLLVHLDPTMVGLGVTTVPTLVAFDFMGFFGLVVAALSAAALAALLTDWVLGGVSAKYGAAAAFVGTLIIASVWAAPLMSPIIFLWDVATFGGLGLPIEIRLLFGVPCVLALLWTSLAFFSALVGTGRDAGGV